MRAIEHMRSQPVKKMPAKGGDSVPGGEKEVWEDWSEGFARFRKPPHPQKRMRNMGCHSSSVNKAAGPPGRKTKWLCIIQSRPGLTVGQSPGSPPAQRCQTSTSAQSCVALGKLLSPSDPSHLSGDGPNPKDASLVRREDQVRLGRSVLCHLFMDKPLPCLVGGAALLPTGCPLALPLASGPTALPPAPPTDHWDSGGGPHAPERNQPPRSHCPGPGLRHQPPAAGHQPERQHLHREGRHGHGQGERGTAGPEWATEAGTGGCLCRGPVGRWLLSPRPAHLACIPWLQPCARIQNGASVTWGRLCVSALPRPERPPCCSPSCWCWLQGPHRGCRRLSASSTVSSAVY